MLIYFNVIIMKQEPYSTFCTMIQHFPRKQGQPVLEQGLSPVLMSRVLVLGCLWGVLIPEEPVLEQSLCSVSKSIVSGLGHLWSFLFPGFLLPQNHARGKEVEGEGA